jgi:hypothetical protein
LCALMLAYVSLAPEHVAVPVRARRRRR